MRTELQIDEEIAALEANRALLTDERFGKVAAMLQARLTKVSSSITTVDAADAGAVGRIQGEMKTLLWILQTSERVDREIKKLRKERADLQKTQTFVQ